MQRFDNLTKEAGADQSVEIKQSDSSILQPQISTTVSKIKSTSPCEEQMASEAYAIGALPLETNGSGKRVLPAVNGHDSTKNLSAKIPLEPSENATSSLIGIKRGSN